jgi:small GTP-binding protein
MAEKRKQAQNSGGPAPATEKDVRVGVFKGESALWRVAMPADGRFALTTSSDGTVWKWGLTEDGPQQGEIACNAGPGFFGLALTADGSFAAAGDGSGTIHLIDLFHGREMGAWKGHDVRVGGLAFGRTGRELVSAAEDGWLRRWTDAGERISQCKVPFPYLYGVAVSADGNRIVGAAVNNGLAIWSGRDGEVPRTFKENISGLGPVSLPASGRFAFTGTDDGMVAKWDLDEGRRVAAFEGHRGSAYAVAVTPDGQFCVSGGRDQTVRLWAVESGQCLAILRGHVNEVNTVAITPDARRIASVGDDHSLRIWDIPEPILVRAAMSRKRGYQNAKVVLLGDSGVGKTGLALRLWHDRWKKTESSHGMEIQRLVLPQAAGPKNDQDEIVREVWLWDLAGQPDYRLTHQLFMEQTSLALFVFDPQSPDLFDTIGYWQQALGKVAAKRGVPGILVAARCDRPGLRLTPAEVRDWAAARQLSGPILTAAKLKTHPGVAELRQRIADLLREEWGRLEFRSTMENFPALKDAILAVRDGANKSHVATPEELEARVRQAAPKLAFTAEDLRAVTGLLAGEGVLYPLPYGGLIVMQPSWLNCYASTLVKLAGEAENQLGHVPLDIIQPGKLPADDATPRLSLEDERQLLPGLVALFLERALAWKQDTPAGPMLVFPNYVRLPRPASPPRPGRTVVYRFTGPLEEIYCTLVVRLHYSGLFTKDGTRLYRQAVDFRTASGKLAALTMKEEGERGELEIYFGDQLDADIQAAFQQFIHDHLHAKAKDVERLRNYFCPKCKEEVTDRRAIDAAVAKGRTKLVCNYCDASEPGVINLFDVLEQQLANKTGEAGADEAGRRAAEEITSASKEGVMVGEVQTIVFSADQIYRIQAEPDEGVDGEIEFRNTKKKATGVTFRVQLKSGDSHLRKRADGTEVFPMKDHYEGYWAGKDAVPVLLIIRSSKGRLRFMNATDAIRAAQKKAPGKPVKQIEFAGEEFTREAVLGLRDERLK